MKAKTKSSAASKARRGVKTPKGTVDAAKLKALAEGARLKRVGDKEFDLSEYRAVKSAGGNSSLDCGDAVAKSLAGLDIDDVYKQASRVLGKDVTEALRKRYAKLNVGMQRMNLGNRIRGASSAKAATA